MNKRAKEIAGQALDKAVSYTWTSLNYEQIQELLAYHAELIVRECANVSVGNDPDFMSASVLEDGAKRMFKHFGVES